MVFFFVTFNPYTKKWVYLITLFTIYLTTVLTNQTLTTLIIKKYKNKDHATKWLLCDYIGFAKRTLLKLCNNPYMFRFWFLIFTVHLHCCGSLVFFLFGTLSIVICVAMERMSLFIPLFWYFYEFCNRQISTLNVLQLQHHY